MSGFVVVGTQLDRLLNVRLGPLEILQVEVALRSEQQALEMTD